MIDVAEDIDTVRIVSTGQRLASRQNFTPGGEPRHTADYDLVIVWNPSEWQAREDWVLRVVYPIDKTLTFNMTYHENKGNNAGAETFFGGGNPRPMNAARIGANFKDLWLTNPIILAAHADALPATDITRAGKPYQRVVLNAHDTEWVMLVDPGTGLPVEVTTIEADPNNAQGPNRVVFSDWREASGVPFPFRIDQYINGDLMRRETRSSIEVNRRDVDDALMLPDDLEGVDENLRAWGWNMSHMLLIRAGYGGPMFTPPIENLRFDEVGPDIYQVTGSSHHQMIIVGPEGIAVVDAPWFPERSEAVLSMLEERWPRRPVRYIIVSHHHLDHIGGFRTFVEAGATLVASTDGIAYYEDALRRAGHSSIRAVAVDNTASIGGIGRTIELYDITNSHSEGAIATYVPDAKLMFNADLFSPGRELQLEQLMNMSMLTKNEFELMMNGFGLAMNEFLTSVDSHGVDVERHVGGHGVGWAPAP